MRAIHNWLQLRWSLKRNKSGKPGEVFLSAPPRVYLEGEDTHHLPACFWDFIFLHFPKMKTKQKAEASVFLYKLVSVIVTVCDWFHDGVEQWRRLRSNCLSCSTGFTTYYLYDSGLDANFFVLQWNRKIILSHSLDMKIKWANTCNMLNLVHRMYSICCHCYQSEVS